MRKLLIIFLVLIAFTACGKTQPQAPPPSAPAQNSGVAGQSLGACEECVANNCYAAGCNLTCKSWGSWCETIVMGDYSPETIASGEVCEFISQRVTKLNAKLRRAGVRLGDTVTHVNDQFAGSNEAVTVKFSDLILTMPEGMKLRLLRGEGERLEVTL